MSDSKFGDFIHHSLSPIDINHVKNPINYPKGKDYRPPIAPDVLNSRNEEWDPLIVEPSLKEEWCQDKRRTECDDISLNPSNNSRVKEPSEVDWRGFVEGNRVWPHVTIKNHQSIILQAGREVEVQKTVIGIPETTSGTTTLDATVLAGQLSDCGHVGFRKIGVDEECWHKGRERWKSRGWCVFRNDDLDGAVCAYKGCKSGLQKRACESSNHINDVQNISDFMRHQVSGGLQGSKYIRGTYNTPKTMSESWSREGVPVSKSRKGFESVGVLRDFGNCDYQNWKCHNVTYAYENDRHEEHWICDWCIITDYKVFNHLHFFQ